MAADVNLAMQEAPFGRTAALQRLDDIVNRLDADPCLTSARLPPLAKASGLRSEVRFATTWEL